MAKKSTNKFSAKELIDNTKALLDHKRRTRKTGPYSPEAIKAAADEKARLESMKKKLEAKNTEETKAA